MTVHWIIQLVWLAVIRWITLSTTWSTETGFRVSWRPLLTSTSWRQLLTCCSARDKFSTCILHSTCHLLHHSTCHSLLLLTKSHGSLAVAYSPNNAIHRLNNRRLYMLCDVPFLQKSNACLLIARDKLVTCICSTHVAILSFALGKRDFFFWLKAHFKNQFVRGKRARRLKGKVIFVAFFTYFGIFLLM